MSTSSLLLLLLSLFGSCYCCCPEPWLPFGSSCYLYIHSSLSWVEANSLCKLVGGDLVEINSAAENLFVKNLLSSNQGKVAWIGIDDIAKDGQWVLTSTRKPAIYTNWSSGEPNNYQGKTEDCGSIYSSGFWNDASCDNSRQYPSVCERCKSFDLSKHARGTRQD